MRRRGKRFSWNVLMAGCLALAFAAGTGLAKGGSKDSVAIKGLPSSVKGPGQNSPTVQVHFKGKGFAKGDRTLWESYSVDSGGFKGAPCKPTAKAQIKAQSYESLFNVKGKFSKNETVNVNFQSGKIYVCLYLTKGKTTNPPNHQAVPINKIGPTVARASKTMTLHS